MLGNKTEVELENVRILIVLDYPIKMTTQYGKIRGNRDDKPDEVLFQSELHIHWFQQILVNTFFFKKGVEQKEKDFRNGKLKGNKLEENI